MFGGSFVVKDRVHRDEFAVPGPTLAEQREIWLKESKFIPDCYFLSRDGTHYVNEKGKRHHPMHPE